MTQMAGNGTVATDDDPLARLERLVNARTARMSAENSRPVRPLTPAAPPPTPPRTTAQPVDDLVGLDEELAAELAAIAAEPSNAAPQVPVEPAAVAQSEPAEAPALDFMLPSLAALRVGLPDDAAQLGETAKQSAGTAPPASRPPFPNPVAMSPVDIELDTFDSEINGAVEQALAAASAAVAATEARKIAPELPVSTHPVPVPDLPAFGDEPRLDVAEADILTAFEQELADEVYHIDEPGEPMADPLVGPAAPRLGVQAEDFERLVPNVANDNGSRRRAALIAAMVGGVAVIGGLSAFGLGGTGTATSEVALVRAEAEPYKKKPENPGGRQVANQDNPVYQRVADATGAKALAKPETRLVNKAEDVSDVRVATVTAKDGDRLDASKTNVALSPESERGAVSPRRVRTLRVGSDGKLIDADAVAASEPVDAPRELAVVVPAPVVPESAPVVSPAAATPRPLEIGGVPVPLGRPSDALVQANVEAKSAPVVNASLATPPANPASETVLSPGEYVMQIASVPDADAARSTYAQLSSRFAGIIGGRGVDYQVAEIPGRGTFHRVRIPAGSKSEAAVLCARYSAAGGSCFVTR